MFPYYHTQSIHDGLVAEGESEVVMLTRSAWAGMQRFGAALWSGDTRSRWDSLKVSTVRLSWSSEGTIGGGRIVRDLGEDRMTVLEDRDWANTRASDR